MTTLEEYLKLDDQNQRPSEYANGIMVPIEAASKEHGAIAANLMYLIGAVLRKNQSRCKVFCQSELVYLASENRCAYPDLVLACEGSQYNGNTLLDPVLIIEVSSPTTEDYDCGTKFKHYRYMPRFSDYILVAQDKVSVEHWRLVPETGKWTLHASLTDKSESLEMIGDLLPLSDIYWDVEAVAYP